MAQVASVARECHSSPLPNAIHAAAYSANIANATGRAVSTPKWVNQWRIVCKTSHPVLRLRYDRASYAKTRIQVRRGPRCGSCPAALTCFADASACTIFLELNCLALRGAVVISLNPM